MCCLFVLGMILLLFSLLAWIFGFRWFFAGASVGNSGSKNQAKRKYQGRNMRRRWATFNASLKFCCWKCWKIAMWYSPLQHYSMRSSYGSKVDMPFHQNNLCLKKSKRRALTSRGENPGGRSKTRIQCYISIASLVGLIRLLKALQKPFAWRFEVLPELTVICTEWGLMPCVLAPLLIEQRSENMRRRAV